MCHLVMYHVDMTLTKDQALVASTIFTIESYNQSDDAKEMVSGAELRELMGLQHRIAHGKALKKYGVGTTPVRGIRMYRVVDLLGLRAALDAELPGWQGMKLDAPIPGAVRRAPGELSGVYIIYNDADPGYYKIGMSDTIITRIKDLSTGSRLPYRFAGIVLCPNQADMTPKKLEAIVHGIAADNRVKEGGGTEFFSFPNGLIDSFLRNVLTEFKLPVLLLHGETADELRVMLK